MVGVLAFDYLAAAPRPFWRVAQASNCGSQAAWETAVSIMN
jgi:hypothetical protein